MKNILLLCLLVVACGGPKERTLTWNHPWTRIDTWHFFEMSFDHGETWQRIHDPITTGNGQWTAKITLAEGDYAIAIRACDAEAKILCSETATSVQTHLK